MLGGMGTDEKPHPSDTDSRERRPATQRGLFRESVYLHPDELAAVEEYARRKRCSKTEVLRRAARAFLGIED
jgi:hypothetical protein